MTRFAVTSPRRRAGLASAVWIILVVVALLLYLTACGGSPAAQPVHAAAAATAAPEQSAYPGTKLDTDVAQAPVGAAVKLNGSGFPAGAAVALSWKTYDGHYELQDNDVVFAGPRYDERVVSLATVTVDGGGAFSYGFTVPEDFGGVHDIAAQIGGKFATKTGFTITPTFSVSPQSGPVGTMITIKGTGLGYRAQESMWEVSWDDGFTGYMMAAATHGTATAQLRLAGPAGIHALKLWRNYRGIPYLNPQQGPFGKLPEPTLFRMNVTADAPVAPAVTADPKPEDTVQPAPAPESRGGAGLALSSDKGTVGSTITLSGQGFPANQPVKLSWATRTGQQITATGLREGFDEQIKDLPDAAAGPDGRFSVQLTVPDDYAGDHRITAASGGSVAEAYYSIYAEIFDFTRQARAGDDVVIHMKGVGWTIAGKTYAVTYDNVYLGYGCSFSTKGDIEMHLPAAGQPGVHVIDLYPATYEGLDPTPNIYSRPDLTYLDNHPGGALPAFRLLLVVTP